ncbi:MAG: 50S ribosomal protein L32 [Ignavibacteria bacterium]|jgi:large subunit ribosomal protein L32|nr:50S ribosomal protein L32 [Ignavibacteria bacterium]MBP9095208.1 50S ribosomal protein L32 [Ignavibacteria bacterium]
MPNPKKRHSKTRGRKRRTHYKATAPATMKCPNCSEPKMMHRVCSNCGFYDGKSIVLPRK